MAFVQSGREPSREPDYPEDADDNVRKLWDLYGRLWDENAAAGPISATIVGDYRFNDLLGSLSKASIEEHIEELKKIRSELEGVNGNALPKEQHTNYLYLTEMLNIEVIAAEKLSLYEFPTQHMFGPHLSIVQAANFHPWRSLEDCETYFSRLRHFSAQTDEMIDAFKEGIKTGKTLPKGSVEAMIPQVKAQAVVEPDNSPLFKLAKSKVESVGGDVDELRVIVQGAMIPAFTRFALFLENEYKEHSRSDAGLWSLPDGSEMYKAAIRYFTSLDLDPQEVHNLGLKEVKRITEKINEVRKTMGKTEGPLSKFAREMETDLANLPKDGDDIINRYKGIIEKAKVRVLDFFEKLPAADLDVKPVEEFRQVASPAAHYYPAPADRSRPGLFYANTYKPETRPLFAMEAICLHEAIPGHHMQIAIAQELENLPRLRKEVQSFTIGYAEGWGLYTEYLGEEMEFYKDPKTYYGRLLTELWRAARLVVDTGIHHLRWSREEAISYMSDNTCLGENEATVEVDRYTVMPGQALAYKIGELKLLELKDLAKKELGDRFSWKDFHRVVLEDGALPLVVLETKINDWLAKKD
mmetsp:Transcript_7283/g.22186  ORF Transcript_7283/g.22186 Transcript_7283/m.22186 type:complete len:582 (-) Transcript_7283:1696-3441(-)|eukprot:CAMPEP_0198728252 /NCGR_PEP_ID=MMETSP1475-20131203/8246_1 /TAXON_ID= ORGANISM="Unidentified sp., Strain CCMP1999" /NCGR_SAMPLE_ID=MMETSP1475 /ASSEMBLY_ACC=CAM_ASM_001111 /LENGTH=581 /DNA_ID=CAMNT_0044490565 /DNA_START=28 /DNA_END=1773 /DNA_ORIENTATION=-